MTIRGRHCNKPWDSISIEHTGEVFQCCESWLPVSIGNIFHNTLEEIWCSPAAERVRESIRDQSFGLCNSKFCAEIAGDRLPTRPDQLPPLKPPTKIRFNNDRSCNLVCPSCRTQRFQITQGPEYTASLEINEKILSYVLSHDPRQRVQLWITGSGDAIGSHIYREMLYNLDGSQYPNLEINIMTNGVLLTPKVWDRLHKIHSNMRIIDISVDAATAGTYNIVRAGGDWRQLNKNIQHLSDISLTKDNILLNLGFVVQSTNYTEMQAFIDLYSKLPRYNSINFTLINDWNTWSSFTPHKIWDPVHPGYSNFVNTVQRLEVPPGVQLGPLHRWRT